MMNFLLGLFACSVHTVISSRGLSSLESVPDYPSGGGIFMPYSPSEGLIPLEDTLEAPSTASCGMEFGDDRMGSRFDDWLHARVSLECDITPPYLMNSKEWISINGSNSTVAIRPTDVIANRLESVLMNLETNPFNSTVPAIIKYQMDCRERKVYGWSSHQLVREYFFLSQINEGNKDGHAIVPRAYWLSSPVELSTNRTVKTDFFASEAFTNICVHVGSHVRYMIVEKTGMSLEDFISYCPGYKLPFIDGMSVLRQLFVSLKQIHSMGIIHGDIHRGNIVRSLRDKTRIMLIDFGLSLVYSSPLSEYPDSRNRQIRADASPWNMRGFASSFRDDIMKSVLTVAALMGGPTHFEPLEKWEESRAVDKLIHYTLFADVFRHPSTRKHLVNDLTYLEDVVALQVIDLLKLLQEEVRSMKRVNDYPKHDELISIIDRVIGIVNTN